MPPRRSAPEDLVKFLFCELSPSASSDLFSRGRGKINKFVLNQQVCSPPLPVTETRLCAAFNFYLGHLDLWVRGGCCGRDVIKTLVQTQSVISIPQEKILRLQRA